MAASSAPDTQPTAHRVEMENKEQLPPPPQSTSTLRRKPVPTSQPHSLPTRTRQGFVTRLRTRWSLLRRRTRILIITAILLLLALIIGLAAGLSSRHSRQDLPLPSAHGGPYSGDLTYYAPGLGACGVTSTNSDHIVAVSHLIFDAVQSGSNPNSNPLCGQKIRAKRVKEGQGEISVDLTVVDRCTGCKPRDLDVTVDTFAELADVSLGRVTVTWAWLGAVPTAASG